MTETANWLRGEKGADFALKEALTSFEESGGMKQHKGLVVFSAAKEYTAIQYKRR